MTQGGNDRNRRLERLDESLQSPHRRKAKLSGRDCLHSMAHVAEIEEREGASPPARADAGAPVAPAPPPSGHLLFRPELFFLGRTEVARVVRNPFVRVAR